MRNAGKATTIQLAARAPRQCGNAAPWRRRFVTTASQRCPWMTHVCRLRDAMLTVDDERASVPRSNVVSGRRTCGGSSPQCCQWSPHVRRLRAAMLSVVAKRAAARRRNVVSDRHTCGGSSPQCCQRSPHVWRLFAAMLSVGATRVALIATTLSVGAACARKRPGTLDFGVSPHFPLTFRLNQPILLGATSEIVRSPTLAAVGGTGVLEKHIRPVPARELSFSPPAAGFRGVYTPRENINRKYRRVAATSSRWPLALVDES